MEFVFVALALLVIGYLQRVPIKLQRVQEQAWRTTVPSDYIPAGALLSPYEMRFYHALRLCAREWQLGVCFKPRAADIVKPQACESRKLWWQRFRFLSQRHIDFVLVDREFQPVLAIELNDRSHQLEERRRRDAELAAVFEAAGLPLIFVVGQTHYDLASLKAQLSAAIW